MDAPTEVKEAVTLELALEAVVVREPGEHPGPAGWFAVEVADLGCVSYHYARGAALKYRLWLINDMVNPGE